jgi:ABC-2 type transport system permease protein
MNLRGVRAIYLFEMARTGRTLLQSIVSPVVSTSLYFVVFGAAIGSRITEIEGVSYLEIVIGYVGAAATKSIILGLVVLATSGLLIPLRIAHPVWMIAFLVLTAVSFSLFGFILGLWADGFEKLQVVPLLIITPLTFLGGTFYSINVLPPIWQTVALCNPVVYLISGFRWSFFETADVSVAVSLAMTVLFLAICLATVWWTFKTGYRLKK